ncbi:MAG: hypothetical protein N838_07495 [Thiohalocapsa sp. PB-PSB1]|jgi:hypothetical protein|nr:MAG: hypothetical protein N838_07495 [Thiohalocapsa sp. PB-PSB1]
MGECYDSHKEPNDEFSKLFLERIEVSFIEPVWKKMSINVKYFFFEDKLWYTRVT